MRICDEVINIQIEQLMPHSLNSFYHSPLREEERLALFESIIELGITEPLWATRSHLIVSGHERWSIAKELKLETVPVRFVEDATADDIIYLLISSNAARRGSEQDFIRKARQAKVLYEHWGIRAGRPKSGHGDHITRHDVAGVFGSSDRTVRRLIKLLDLIPELQQLVSDGIIGLRAGNDLAELSEQEQHEICIWLRHSHLKEVRVEEVRAIRKEIEYMRHRDVISQTLGMNKTTTLAAIAPTIASKYSESNPTQQVMDTGIELEQKAEILVQPTTNETEPKTKPESESELKTLTAIHSLVPVSNAENIKRRVLLIQIERVMRQIERWDDELFQLLEQEETDTEIDEQIQKLVRRLKDTSNRILALRKNEH